MDPKLLQQAQTKVEAGEPLSEPELRALEQAALAEPGPRWRLAIAHALINAEHAQQALPLLEALVREYPTYPQALMGLARALIALDRHRQAEQVLGEARAQAPSDPEILKVLAVLALRREERTLARALIAEALALDPFDTEAQVISGELDPAAAAQPEAASAPAPVAIASERAFVEALLRELESRAIQHLRRGRHVYVKTAGRIGRLEVRELYEGYVRDGKPVEVVAAELAADLSKGDAGPLDGAALLEAVRPVLRDEGFQQKAPGALSRALSAELRCFYVLHDDALVRYLPAALARQHGLSDDELHRRAFENLARRAVELKRVRVEPPRILPTGAGSGLVASWEGDGYDGARLLLPEVQAQLRAMLGPGPLRVHLGHRELAIVCSAADAASVKALDGLKAEDGVPGAFELREDGALHRARSP